jgi:putative ABC transport system permease protein
MNALWRQIVRGCRALWRRADADRDVADEIQHYLDEAAAAHRASGLPDDQARRAARVELGGVAAVTEQVRGSGWENSVRAAMFDVRYAARRLRRDRAFAAVAIVTIALGIGATAAIFSAVDVVLFEPLPYPAPNRIATIWELSNDGQHVPGSFGMYRSLAGRSRSFETIAVFRAWQPTLTGRDEAERLEGQRVSWAYFRVLAVPPRIGRDFAAADDRSGGPNVAIVSDGLWRRRFDADPAIVGREVTLNDSPYIVVGVMPRGFENVLAPAADVWSPLQYDITEGRAWGHHLRTIGRLRTGASTESASRELATLAQAIVTEQHPATYGEQVLMGAVPLRDDVTGGVRRGLLAILAGVCLVLVIASVNVTNLLLARGVQRRGEFALRAALGAGRGRLIRQLLAESLLLALLGGIAGMAVAALVLQALVALSPADLPRAAAIRLDGSVFLFGLAITTAIGIAFGIIPALHAARSNPHTALQQGSARSAGGGHRRVRRALVIAEVALALVLLVTSGLLLRSLRNLFAVPVGFDASHVLTMQVQSTGRRFDDIDARRRFFTEALDAVRRVPGVSSAGLTSQLPLSGEDDEYGVHFEGGRAGYSTFRYAVSPGYIETLRIPLLRGRTLDDRDGADTPPVALINESFATATFPGVDPLGKRLHIGPLTGPLYTIVGIVGDVRHLSLAVEAPVAVYTTSAQWPQPDAAMSLVVRTRDAAASFAPAIREAVRTVDSSQPIVRIATMDDLLAASAAQRRFALLLFEAFAIAALALAAAGIYGIMAGSVAERTREIGVRAALGATRADILSLVLGEGLMLTAIGTGLGLAGAAVASRGLGALLFGVSRLDPLTHAAGLALLAVVSLAACGVPAWRAQRVDPARTLRAE